METGLALYQGTALVVPQHIAAKGFSHCVLSESAGEAKVFA